MFDEGGIFSAERGGLVHSFHVGIVGVVDETRGASRRKTEEEWRDWSRCCGLVHDGDVKGVQQVFGVYDIVHPNRSFCSISNR